MVQNHQILQIIRSDILLFLQDDSEEQEHVSLHDNSVIHKTITVQHKRIKYLGKR
jgi:hypothetical protein